jgi:hypothetical protein
MSVVEIRNDLGLTPTEVRLTRDVKDTHTGITYPKGSSITVPYYVSKYLESQGACENKTLDHLKHLFASHGEAL